MLTSSVSVVPMRLLPVALASRPAGSVASSVRLMEPMRLMTSRRHESPSGSSALRSRPLLPKRRRASTTTTLRPSASAEASGCPVLRLRDESNAAFSPPEMPGSLLQGVLQALSLLAPALAGIALLPKSAPVWLCGLCALGAAAAGAAIKSLLEAAYWSRRWAGLDLPPVVKEGKQPILGHISKIFDQSFLQECRDTHGPVFSLELPLLSRHPVPVIHGAPEVHELLGSENDLVLSSWPTGVTELLGEKSLLATHGDEHKRLRQVLNQVLSDSMIVKYGTPMTLSLMDEFAQRWCRETLESGGVNMWDAARDFTFVVSIRFILGVDIDEETSRKLRKDFDLFTAGLFAPDTGLPFGPFHEAKKARKRMDVAFSKIFNEFLPLYNAGKAPKGALYVVMEEAKKGGVVADVEFVNDQMMNLLFAGTETTSGSFVSACRLLDGRDDIIRPLREELSGLSPEESMNPQLAPFTRAVANEVFRMRPAVPRVFRKILKGFEIHGKTIPAGSTVMLSSGIETYHTADEPEEFRPERWLGQKKLPDSFMAFGHGPRVCPGRALALAEVHAMLRVLSCDYEWSILNSDELPEAGPSTNIRMSFKPLNDTTEEQLQQADPSASSAPAHP